MFTTFYNLGKREFNLLVKFVETGKFEYYEYPMDEEDILDEDENEEDEDDSNDTIETETAAEAEAEAKDEITEKKQKIELWT